MSYILCIYQLIYQLTAYVCCSVYDIPLRSNVPASSSFLGRRLFHYDLELPPPVSQKYLVWTKSQLHQNTHWMFSVCKYFMRIIFLMKTVCLLFSRWQRERPEQGGPCTSFRSLEVSSWRFSLAPARTSSSSSCWLWTRWSVFN